MGGVEAGAELGEGLFGGECGGLGFFPFFLGGYEVCTAAGKLLRIRGERGELFVRGGEGLAAGFQFSAQTFSGEGLFPELVGEGGALNQLFFQLGDGGVGLVVALVGGFEIRAGLAEDCELGFDGGKILFGSCKGAASLGLAAGGDNRIGAGGKTGAEFFDDGIELDVRKAGADALADGFVVESRPSGEFALARPEETKEAPVFGLRGAATGQC